MSCTDHPDFPVGTLVQLDPQTKQTGDSFTLHSNEEVYIGRDKKRCQYVIDDPFISNRHLRIYAIIFDQENPGDVAPLVYAQDISMNGTLWNDYPMGERSGSFLLSDGDALKLSPNFHLLYRCDRHMEEDRFDMIQQIEREALMEKYIITQRKLGSGAYGQVYMAFKKETGQQFACKMVDVRGLRKRVVDELDQKSSFFTRDRGSNGDSDLVAVRERRIKEKLDAYNREATVLELLCHPNIISVEKVVKSRDTIYFFQELITAGDLFSFIQYKGGKLDDIEAAVIVRQVVLALNYLHGRNIVHRDLKPDNILMTSLADGGRVVLTDFGCARLIQPAVQRMSTVVGTYEYSAPEVIRSKNQGYTKAVDLWSLGCVTVALLTGYPPFGDQPNETSSGRQAQECDIERLEEEMNWNNTGHRAQDFVSQLLVLDETKRMDVKQALKHSWFTNPAHKHEFEALYNRSVRDWRPRERKSPLIVDLETFTGVRDDVDGEDQSLERVSLSGSSVEHYDVPSQVENQSSGLSRQWAARQRETLSPTLSDPALPALTRVGNRQADRNQDILPPRADSMDCEVNTVELLSRVRFLSSSEPSLHSIRYGGSQLDEREEGISNGQIPHTLGSIEGSMEMDIQFPSTRKIRKSIWDDFDGEVYEELNNIVTGESQHFAYGARAMRY